MGVNKFTKHGDRMSRHNHQKSTHETLTSTAAVSSGTTLARDKRSQPAADQIRLRAYEISQARKGGPGDALADWIQAEQEATTGSDVRR